MPKAREGNNIEKLNRERELVGIYLSAHPLDDYKVILERLCNVPCADLKGRDTDLEEFSKKTTLTFGGIVTDVKQRFSSRTNKPFGIITIEDYTGTGEFTLFGEEWTRFSGMFANEYTIYVTASCVERFKDSGKFSLKIQNVQFLNDVKEHNLERITLQMDSDKLDEALVNDILTVVDDNPGNVQLYFSIKNPESKQRLVLHASRKGLNLNKKVIAFVESQADLEYYIN